MEQLQETIKVDRLPDMLFGQNKLVLQTSQLSYEFNPVDCLNTSNFKTRQEMMIQEQNPIPINHVNVNPQVLQVSAAKQWQNKKIPKKALFIEGQEQDNEMISIQEIKKESLIKTEVTKEEIPVSRLGPENPIKWFKELLLYQDELGDFGKSKANVRVRAMEDCWFLLFRSYVKIFDVAIRICDTRAYHEFGTNEIIRDFQYREANYQELIQSGFDFHGEWIQQGVPESDALYKFIKPSLIFKDKITF